MTALLTAIVVWCLLFRRMQTVLLLMLCVFLGASLAMLGRHGHTRFPAIDVLAQSSRLNQVHPGLKFWSVLATMASCVVARSPVVGILISATMLALTVWAGGLKLHDCIHLLSLPATFLLISGLALLFEAAGEPIGVLNLRLSGVWLCVTADAQRNAALVMSRALGAVSCLYLLSLTTPVPEIIDVLRRAHCPDVVINLMYLIYRYLFVLLSMYDTMKDAAASRLGFANCRTGVRTTGSLYANLLARSYRQCTRNYDAMESRGFDGAIRFWETKRPIRGAHCIVATGIVAVALALTLTLR